MNTKLSAEDLKRVRQRLEEVASANRRPLPDQDAIARDIDTLCGALENLIDQLIPEASGDYSRADIWKTIKLLADAHVESLDDV